MTEARGILLVVSLMATTALTLALGITDPAAPMSYPTKFLVWNLVLAWIPMVFAIAFDLVERRLWLLPLGLSRVSEEMQYIYPDLAAEFGTVVMQVRAGQERTVAFNQFVKRTGIEDIKSLAAMIVQSEKFGTSLAQALKVYAEALRTRRKLRAEAAVGKAGIKMLFPIVLFILPVLFVVTLIQIRYIERRVTYAG